MAIFRRKNKLNFSLLNSIVSSGMNAQSNYQKVVICHLVRTENLRDSKISICESLKNANPKDKRDIAHYKNCPVWRVLTTKNIIVQVENDYKLNAKLSESEKKEIAKICMESLRK